MTGQPQPGQDVVHFPAAELSPVDVALEELELVYAFIFARVGNRFDAEDLTQQVAMKAIPRLRAGAGAPAIRAYLFATARSVLATFWAGRFGIPEEELKEELTQPARAEPGSGAAAELAAELLAGLQPNYRRVLELRFLRGYSLREVAAEMGMTTGNVKVVQLRALRAAARTKDA